MVERKFTVPDHSKQSFSVESRHHDVENGQLRLEAVFEEVGRFATVLTQTDLVASAPEPVADYLPDRLVVVDDQDLPCQSSSIVISTFVKIGRSSDTRLSRRGLRAGLDTGVSVNGLLARAHTET
jgi:hypothetical protein